MNAVVERRGVFFLLVGPAGAGKNYVLEHLKHRVEGLRQLPTATTRPMRSTEQQNREHEFMTQQQFADMIHHNELVEYQLVHGNLYGIPRRSVERLFAERRAEMADIEYLGADAAVNLYGKGIVRIFVAPPSATVLVERLLVNRRTPYHEIAYRMLRTPVELEYASQCDYVLMNDGTDALLEQAQAIVEAEQEDRRAGIPRAVVPKAALGALVDVRCGRYVLRPAHHPAVLPALPFERPEWPHLAAERALQPLLDAGLPRGDWGFASEERDVFSAPDRLDISSENGLERFIYRYTYNVPHTRFTPEGWNWAYVLRPADGYGAG